MKKRRRGVANVRTSRRKWDLDLRLTLRELPRKCELVEGVPYDGSFEERMRLFAAEIIKLRAGEGLM